MKFQDFCETLQDDQVVQASEALLFKYNNTKLEVFSIAPEDIKRFLSFVVDNFSEFRQVWEDVNSRKDKFFNYEEKSYRAIYKYAEKGGLKTISSAGSSQTKALTKLIAKLICFLTGNIFLNVESNTFFDKGVINSALSNWQKIFEKSNENNNITIDQVSFSFAKWISLKNLSAKTARSYPDGIIFSDKYLDKINYTKESLYFGTVEELRKALIDLNGCKEWKEVDKNGHGMYSSALRKLIEFFIEINEITLLTKPFLLLAGISGTGKTRFVRKQAFASSGNNSLEDTYCLVSVRPDWHEPSDLLGYTSRLSGDTNYVTTEVLQFLVKAWQEIEKVGIDLEGRAVKGDKPQLDGVRPYWLCLDEMNLAPVEQYFADYLSVLETREWKWDNEKFSYSSDPLLTSNVINNLSDKGQKNLRSDLGLTENDELWEKFRTFGIGIPFNLIVAGTVNMDETTHGFSRKVIDRALSFDFGEFFPNNYDEYFSPKSEPKTLSYPIWSNAHDCKNQLPKIDADGVKTIDFLKSIDMTLNNTPFELAFRALNELLLSVISNQPQTVQELQAVWDDFLMCKVLPRIEGDAGKLASIENTQNSILDDLLITINSQLGDIIGGEIRPDLCRQKLDLNDKTIFIGCRSLAKLTWMKNRLGLGFTSFWP